MSWVSDRQTEHLMCRNLRHAWEISIFRRCDTEEVATQKLSRFAQVIVRDLTCLRCDTVRHEYFGREHTNQPFARIRGHYFYPKGYLHHKEDGDTPQRWEYLHELIVRELE